MIFIPFFNTFQYLEAVQDLSGYQTVAFPPCTCSVRNNGFVTPRITYDHLELTACSANGIQEVKVNLSRIFYRTCFHGFFFSLQNTKISFDWAFLEQHSLHEDGSIVIVFRSDSEKEKKEPHIIHLHTIYVSSDKYLKLSTKPKQCFSKFFFVVILGKIRC